LRLHCRLNCCAGTRFADSRLRGYRDAAAAEAARQMPAAMVAGAMMTMQALMADVVALMAMGMAPGAVVGSRLGRRDQGSGKRRTTNQQADANQATQRSELNHTLVLNGTPVPAGWYEAGSRS
jgi:hypothetical protein